jgi:hypothetical protein
VFELLILLVLQDGDFTNDFVLEENSPWGVSYKLVEAVLLDARPQVTTKTAVGVSPPWVAKISYGGSPFCSVLVLFEKIRVLVDQGPGEEQNLEKEANEGVAPAEREGPATSPGSMQVEDENRVVQEGSEGGAAAAAEAEQVENVEGA